MKIPTIETRRLILRGFEERDLDAYAEMCADAEVMQYIGRGNPLDRAESWRSMAMLIGHWELRGYGLWAVEDRQTGTLLGRVGCWQPEGWLGLELGWTIRKAFWGQGYATEAAIASRDYAFTVLNAAEVISLIRPNNSASRRVAEKIGAQLAETTVIFGAEAVVYRLCRQDWQQPGLDAS